MVTSAYQPINIAELSILSEIKLLQLKKEVKCAKLHTYVDASQEAYGTAVYIKVEYKDGSSSIRLVAFKTKVAPLHSISIPRLELMGAADWLNQLLMPYLWGQSQ